MKTSLIDYFFDSVRRNPSHEVVWDANNTYTFLEIAKRAIALSDTVHQISMTKGRIVAVYLPKSVGVTISDFAILMSGNGFMNLDVATPVARIGEILRNVEPPLILSNAKGIRVLQEVYDGKIVDIDSIKEDEKVEIPNDKWHYYGYQMIDADPFCIINTSGSTGVPKGVVTPFRAFHNFVLWTIEKYKLGIDVEVAASVSPVYFDAFVLELLLMSVIGLKQVLVPDSYRMFPVKILQLMKEQNVSFFLWVPTIAVNIANAGVLEEIPLPSLKVAWLAGEVCPPKQINQWIRANPQAQFVNLYGPMEVTVICTYYDIPGIVDETKPIPIGKAVDNYDVKLLKENGDVVESEDEEGEICVRGSIIAYGYYGLKEKTNGVFCQVPWHDKYHEPIYHTGDYGAYNNHREILFRGRKDTLIKHSGYRIELAEIEHAILSSACLVQHGCIVYDFKNKDIVLFYESTEELEMPMVRKRLMPFLPKYMLPTSLRRLDVMPRNAAGKVDRALLNKQVNI